MNKNQNANFEAWDRVTKISIGNAAHLWEGFEPEANNKVSDRGDVLSRHKFLKERIFKFGVLGQGIYPKGHHQVNREVLKQIAEEIGERPKFLYPDERNLESEAKLNEQITARSSKKGGRHKEKYYVRLEKLFSHLCADPDRGYDYLASASLVELRGQAERYFKKEDPDGKLKYPTSRSSQEVAIKAALKHVGIDR
jgi:hypothetical protein